MADATYRESVEGQINGNVYLSWAMKEGIINVLNRYFSEAQIKRMSAADKKRFFYRNGQTDISEKIMSGLTSAQKSTIQKQVNRLARNGLQSDNAFVRENFSASYTRGGHKYVNGRRLY